MLNPKLLAPWLASVVLAGCHAREINAAPAALPMRAEAKVRRPSSRRARKVLAIAYLVRRQTPVSPDAK